MRQIFLFILIGTFFSCSSSNNQEKLDSESRIDSLEKTVKSETEPFDFISKEITEEFCLSRDISGSFDSSYYGAFGNNYQRIDLIIDSMVKSNGPCSYDFFGSTILKGKQVGYVGKLKIDKVEQSNTDLYGMNSGSFQTDILANYELVEDQSISGAGVFKGNFKLTIHENKDGSLDYNTFDWMQDGYSNYIFDGIWVSPNGNEYKAYFADGKLEIGDLNVGAGEFVPNEKYLKYGWESYMKQLFPNG